MDLVIDVVKKTANNTITLGILVTAIRDECFYFENFKITTVQSKSESRRKFIYNNKGF